MEKKNSTFSIAIMAMFTAIILIMAFTPFLGYIPLGFTRATLIHIPVIIASIVLGPKKGAVLGFIFGLTSFINNTINPTLTSFVFTPFYFVDGAFSLQFADGFWNVAAHVASSLAVCFVPRILVGVVPYYIYKAFTKTKVKNIVSYSIAGLAGSLTNTILVMGLIGLLFGGRYAQATGKVLHTVILTTVAVNGLPEAVIAALITAGVSAVLMRHNKKNAGIA